MNNHNKTMKHKQIRKNLLLLLLNFKVYSLKSLSEYFHQTHP